MGRSISKPLLGSKVQASVPLGKLLEVSDFLVNHKEAIISAWESRVMSEERVVELTGLALRDDIPEFLGELAVWLASDREPERALVSKRAFKHVIQRLDAGFPLAQVFREYRFLRETIIEQVLGAEAAEQERTGAAGETTRITRIKELARLNAGLDILLSQSVEQFVAERDRRAEAQRDAVAADLRNTETRYHALFESIDEGFCLVEMLFDGDRPVDFRFLEVNPAFERHTRLVNATGKRISELFPEYDKRWLESFGRVAQTREALRFESSIFALNRFFDVYAFPGGTPEQRQVAILFSDISKRKRSELERDRSLQEARSAQHQVKRDLDAMTRLQKLGSIFLRDGNIDAILFEILDEAIAISEAAFGNIQIIDLETSSLKIVAQRGFPQWWLDFWSKVQKGQSVCGSALELGQRVIVEDVEKSPLFVGTTALEIQLRAGVRAVQSTPLVSRSGNPLGMFSTHFRVPTVPTEHQLRLLDLLSRHAADIIERANFESALRESEERFRALVNASSDVVFRMNPDWSELREIRGRGLTSDSEGPTRNWLQKYIYSEDQPRLLSVVKDAIANKCSLQLEHRAMRPDGSVGWLFSRTIPLTNARGEVVEWFGASSDITDRKVAEETLKNANQQLADADRRKNEFIAMLSHELRNPLAPIRSSLYILDRAPPGGEQASRAQAIIGRQVQHLTRMVDDLLDVSRITRGKAVLQRERIDLCELARRTVEDHRSAFVEREIDLHVSTEPTEVWVNGDRTRLSQAIGNLLTNAVKFTPMGGKTTVTVSTDIARGHAVVQVQDTGRGIAPELMPRLFEAFTQADLTLDRKLGGLGLGLALVKGLVEMHEGSVTAKSEGLGRGATFTIRLPLEANAQVESKRPVVLPAPARRVLVVEDSVDAAKSLREALKLAGHTVEIALNGPDALEKARSFHPEVVLCDIGLPEMDGYQVARALRLDAKLKRARLVALTGYGAPEDIAKAKDAGFDAHLVKPASLDAVHQVLHGG